MKIGKYKRDKLTGDYDVIIIGSGISGLCSAALLSMEGKKVLVLEKHFKIGGYTHTFRRQNYEWDVGIHYIGGMHKKHSFSRKLFDKITDNNLKWNKTDDNYDRIIFPDNFPFESCLPRTISCSCSFPTGPTIIPSGFNCSSNSFGNSLAAAVIIIEYWRVLII
jgi:hypothetical protein